MMVLETMGMGRKAESLSTVQQCGIDKGDEFLQHKHGWVWTVFYLFLSQYIIAKGGKPDHMLPAVTAWWFDCQVVLEGRFVYYDPHSTWLPWPARDSSCFDLLVC